MKSRDSGGDTQLKGRRTNEDLENDLHSDNIDAGESPLMGYEVRQDNNTMFGGPGHDLEDAYFDESEIGYRG